MCSSDLDNKTKPVGALGQLEDLALQLGLIQRSDVVTFDKPQMVVSAQARPSQLPKCISCNCGSIFKDKSGRSPINTGVSCSHLCSGELTTAVPAGSTLASFAAQARLASASAGMLSWP